MNEGQIFMVVSVTILFIATLILNYFNNTKTEH